MLSAIAVRKAAQAAKRAAQPEPEQNVPEAATESDQVALVAQGTKNEESQVTASKRKLATCSDAGSEVEHKKTRKRRTAIEAESALNVPQDSNHDISAVSSSESDSEEEFALNPSGESSIVSQFPDPSILPTESAIEPLRHSGFGKTLSDSCSFDPIPGKNVFYIDTCSTILSGRCGTVVAIQTGDSLGLIGVYSLTVLRGTISLLGTEISANASITHTVYAPKCSPVPFVEFKAAGNEISVDLASILPEDIIRVLKADVGVIFFEDCNTGVEGIGNTCRIFEKTFDSVIAEDVFRLHTAKLVTPMLDSMQPFQLPSSWQNAMSTVSKVGSLETENDENFRPIIILVRGSKRTGKSTFARTVMNRLLSRYRRVAFLECDVGQTEFTPPGLVALNVVDRPMLGPPFTHPLLPFASHFIGATTPRNSPARYLASIQSLMQTYKVDVQFALMEDDVADLDDMRMVDLVPLVVNSMGWTKGLGADLEKEIEKLVEPTHIFSMQNPSEDSDASPWMTREQGRSVHRTSEPRVIEIDAIPSWMQISRYTSADWRTISIMSYLHSIPSSSQYHLLPPSMQPHNTGAMLPISKFRDPLCSWDCRLPLLARRPYAVSPKKALDSIFLVCTGAEDVIPSELGRVLNGSIIALVARQPGALDIQLPSHQKLPYSQGAEPPDPATSNCIGLALIRSVSPSLIDDFVSPCPDPADPSIEDEREDTLHVLTPVPPGLISAAGARYFVKGDIELPVWGMLDYRKFDAQGNYSGANDDVPYLQWNRNEALGGERRRIRRNLMRRAQM